MAQLVNTFEGGTDGVAIDTDNSGGASGDSFDFMTGTGTAVYEDTSPLHGSLSALLTATNTNPIYMTWIASWAGASEVWVRIEGRFADATPGTNIQILRFREANGSTVGCDVRITSTGTIQLRAPLTLRYTSSTALTDGQDFRLEVHVVSSATVGHIEARLFVGANLDGTTPDESFGSATDDWDTGDGTVGGFSFGVHTDPGAAGMTMTMDNIVLSDEGWVGPAVTTVTGTGATTDSTDTASAAGTHDPPEFTAAGTPTDQPDTATASGTFATPEFAGSAATTDDLDVASGSATFTAPVYAASGSPADATDTSSGAGVFAPPEGTGSGSPIDTRDTAAASGTFTPGSITGTGTPVDTIDTASGTATFTAPTWTATGAPSDSSDVASGVATFTLPSFTGAGTPTDGRDIAVGSELPLSAGSWVADVYRERSHAAVYFETSHADRYREPAHAATFYEPMNADTYRERTYATTYQGA